MATVQLGKIMFDYASAWGAGWTYEKDQIVTYGGGTYICVTRNAGQKPLRDDNGRLNSQYWNIFQEGFTWKGNWASGVTYYPNDIVFFGNSSYICRVQHVSSKRNRDPWYNPYGEWEVFVQGGADARPSKQVKMLGNRGPIGWYGHPNVPDPNWGNAAYIWNGNTPRNIPAIAKHWLWNQPSGVGRHIASRTAYWIGRDGQVYGSGNSSNYSHGADSPTWLSANPSDPSYQRWYINNSNQSAGLKGADYKNDTSGGSPMALQTCFSHDHLLTLWNNGTVTYMGYGGNSESGSFHASSTTQGAMLMNFPQGTTIVKIASTSESGNGSAATTNFALDSEGGLWSWGYNGYGQCGLGSEPSQGKIIGAHNSSTTNVQSPTLIPRWAFDGKRIVDMFAAGGAYGMCYALDESGMLWSWGHNGSGQLGYPTNSGFVNASYSTVPLPYGRGLVSGGKTWVAEAGIQKVLLYGGDGNDAYCGSYILDGQGYIWWCGYNGGYAVGDGATTASTSNAGNPIRINFSAGTGLNGAVYNMWYSGGYSAQSNVFVRKSDGSIYGWGRNDYYELGTNSPATYTNSATFVNGLSGNVLTINGTGTGNYNQFNALVIDSNNRMRVWVAGYNNWGSLGIGYDGSTHATGGQNGTGMFHPPNGWGQYYWKPRMIPAGDDRMAEQNRKYTDESYDHPILDVEMCGWTTEGYSLQLFSDGVLYATGHNYTYITQPIGNRSFVLLTRMHNSD